MRSTWTLRLQSALAAAAVLVAMVHSASTAKRPVSTPSLLPPPLPKHSRRQIEPSASLYAPAFLPTPLPPLSEEDFRLAAVATPFRPHREHKLTQPKKPVYHYTPIKPFSEEELGEVYKGKGRASPPRNVGQNTRYGFAGGNLFQPAIDKLPRDGPYFGPQVHEYSVEPPLPSKPIQPPTPIAPGPAVHVGQGVQLQVALPVHEQYNTAALIPDTELLDIKAIRLGEAVGLGTASVVQRQNPAHEKYHFEYRIRDHLGDFGHAEAKDGSMTTGGYDVNLHKTHVQSVRYFVDSKEVPIYAHQYHHVV